MLNKIIQTLKQQKKVYIITHVNPDGDALGSSFGLKYILSAIGISAEVVLCEKIPHRFEFMGWNPIIYNDTLEADCAIGVDFGEISRSGICAPLFENAKTQIIIDHHLDDAPICDLFYTEPKEAATGQIICDIAKMLGASYTKEIAKALYTAIMTDTGGCRYSNTTKKTHMLLSELIEFVDTAYLCRMLFEVTSPKQFALEQALLKDIEFFENGRISVITAKKEHCSDEDLLGSLVNTALNIEGAEVGILFKERSDREIKISLRTTGNVNAADICKSFSGGGHKNAAGCTINETLDVAKKLFIEKVKSALF